MFERERWNTCGFNIFRAGSTRSIPAFFAVDTVFLPVFLDVTDIAPTHNISRFNIAGTASTHSISAVSTSSTASTGSMSVSGFR